MLYEFRGRVWKDPKANWYFVNVNKKISHEIKTNPNSKANKYGLIKIKATIGKTSWNPTLFPTKHGDYVLAIKADVRKKEKIENDTVISIRIYLS